jgi:hypothetical protein
MTMTLPRPATDPARSPRPLRAAAGLSGAAGGIAIPALLAAAALLAPPAWSAVQVEQGVQVAGASCDRISWLDAAGKPRWISLVHGKDQAGLVGGYVNALAYDAAGVTRTCTASGSPIGGFGHVIMHGGRADAVAACSKSHGQDLVTKVLFAGANHALYAITLTIPTTIKDKQGQVHDSGPVAIIIHYSICSGRSDFVYAISFDTSKTTDLGADTRTPYSEFDWSGSGGWTVPISGIGWAAAGKRFRTLDAPLTYDTAWDWTADCAIPHVIEWQDATLGDAEFGMVQTQTEAQHDAGAGWWAASAGKSGKKLPENWNLPYQLNAYENVTSKKATWMMPYGAVGSAAYDAYGSGHKASGKPWQGYSLLCVYDRWSEHGLDRAVDEMTAVHGGARLTASTGTVVAEGPRGLSGGVTIPYQPAGWNHLYAQWAVACAGNAAAVTLEMPKPGQTNPTFCFSAYGLAKDPVVTCAGTVLKPDVDCFISVDAPGKRCLVTLNRTVVGTLSLAIHAP